MQRIHDDRPSQSAFAITPDNSNDLPEVVRFIYVGGTGDLTVILENDETEVTLKDVPVGALIPMRVKRVKATGTDATFLVGFI